MMLVSITSIDNTNVNKMALYNNKLP